MESVVVSDRLKELIDGCEVKAGVFTTYTFEPDFFELEVIPLLLTGDTPFSSDSRVKEFQVRDALRQACLPLEVFYDLQMFRREGQVSPSMEYLCHGVHAGNAAFHPKLNLILAYSEEYESEYLLVGAGSNNLSQAGWWDNVECQHWEVVWPDEVERTFLKQLRLDVALLASWQHLSGSEHTSALNKVASFLAGCRGHDNEKAPGYFGLTESPKFKSFVRNFTKKRLPYTNWTLEIISPFFADDAHNKEHEFFYTLGVEKIHLLLPIDQESRALCQQAYFNHINEQEYIEWAEWAPSKAKVLGVDSQNYRRLHAKVYHFYNKRQSWVFVGSVNFTHKAMHDNVEAGFFVKLGRPEPLLKVLKQPEPSEFNPPTENVPGSDAVVDELSLPEIHLQYDWLSRSLVANTDPSETYHIDILTPEGKPAIASWLISDRDNTYTGNVEDIERLLKNGSLVTVAGFSTSTGDAFSSHPVMLQQTGWSHKPIDMPDLSTEQILAIYAGMSPDRRQLLMMNAMVKQLVLAKAAGEMTILDEDIASEEFFSEYAEIFHAFRQLMRRLQEALDARNITLVDYYLTGQGMDSLPTLIERAIDDDTTVKPVTAYLLLLSAREIYEYKPLANRPLIKDKLIELDKNIRLLKDSSRIQLEDNSSARRKMFFSWFEQQFFKQYRVSEDSP